MMSEATSGDSYYFVKDSLFKFISTHLPNADLSVIDDIIMSYVYSTFDVCPEEFFDQINDVLADFMDMISGYIADFNEIDRDTVWRWMVDIVTSLADMEAAKSEDQRQDEARALDYSETKTNDAATEKPKSKGSRSSSTSEDISQEKAAAMFFDDEEYFTEFAMMMEMFPDTNPVELKHCLSIACGDAAEAIACVLHRREHGQAVDSPVLQAACKAPAAPDHEIRSRIIERYSYVDEEADTKDHKPTVAKDEPKKMIRYRDNKIVSLKGERYTEVSKTDEEGGKKSNKKHNP